MPIEAPTASVDALVAASEQSIGPTTLALGTEFLLVSWMSVTIVRNSFLVLSCKVRGAAPADWALGVLAVAQLLILLPWHGVGLYLASTEACAT